MTYDDRYNPFAEPSRFKFLDLRSNALWEADRVFNRYDNITVLNDDGEVMY